MPRTLRFTPNDIPVHIIQRGNNRQACFFDEQDYIAYSHWLKQYAHEYKVDIHAWVFMTNHVHLLCTPRQTNGISLMMQALGRQYVRYINKTYSRSGTLWEGRFKSSLVQTEAYLLQVYRYIELNPVRAGMVSSPDDYKWSSYQINAKGKHSELCAPHEVYLALANSPRARLAAYQQLVKQQLDTSIVADITLATHKGLAIGDPLFMSRIEALAVSATSHAKAS
ncbi:transposase [Shewanella maritima]|uniref:Transposase n=1 Tax=Shewanella maritima TaxID=2520507 RepID=A0A411PJY9_9GAMM|nr:transposase [Shewanella maritima]QBF83808.1 transposase [Shewanella maritima]